MSSQQEFLRTIVELLDRSGIAYMVAGSLASSFHGEPRATRDVDIVIECDRPQLDSLLDGVRALSWYVSDEAATDALERRATFNVIDPESGWKADLIIRRDRAFSLEEFHRRIAASLLGEGERQVPVVGAEDSILSKLEWHRESGADQQYRDALGIAAIREDDLDVAYLTRWADRLDLRDSMERLLAEVAGSNP